MRWVANKDLAYNAINLAFVLDLIGEQEKGEIDEGKAARETSLKVRNEIVAVLDPVNEIETEQKYVKLRDPDLMLNWWVLVTLGEAWLGIGDYYKATDWMTRAAKLKESLRLEEDASKHIAPWQLETAARQIAQGARIRAQRDGVPPDQLEISAPWAVVKALLGTTAKPLDLFFGERSVWLCRAVVSGPRSFTLE